MPNRLPKVLKKEPLVDAVFEVRFEGASHLADVLPGFLLHEIEPKPSISRLPAAELPYPVRANDLGLKFAPILRLDIGRYLISIGDQNIVISCKLPYPKWPSFKEKILEILKIIEKAGIEGGVERYSLKYVNLIQAPTIAEQIEKIRINILLGDIEVSSDHISLKVHRKEDGVLHIVSVVTGAQGQMPNGDSIVGAVVDIDSIREINADNFNAFVSDLEEGIEKLRQANKVKFFACLKSATIEDMEPTYE